MPRAYFFVQVLGSNMPCAPEEFRGNNIPLPGGFKPLFLEKNSQALFLFSDLLFWG